MAVVIVDRLVLGESVVELARSRGRKQEIVVDKCGHSGNLKVVDQERSRGDLSFGNIVKHRRETAVAGESSFRGGTGGRRRKTGVAREEHNVGSDVFRKV